jgi:acyl-coenzyme A thioesterase 13
LYETFPSNNLRFAWLTNSADAGVSRTLNTTYIRPIPAGTTVLIESEVIHAGKRLCSLQGVMKRESDGAVLATCEHGKVSIDPQNNKL